MAEVECRNSLSGNMCQSKGKTPLTLNPDSIILSGVITLENAIPTMAGMSYIDTVRPLFDTIKLACTASVTQSVAAIAHLNITLDRITIL